MHGYKAPPWLAGVGAWGGNVQTIWPALFSHHHDDRRPRGVPFQRERWTTPDEDFIDVDWYCAGPADAERPLLVLFHGLEGSSESHYAQAFAHWAHERDWDYAVPHFRGCSGEPNRAPRTYHSGDFEEVGWILSRFKAAHHGPVMAMGISLGGNALLRWVEEAGSTASSTVCAAAAVSAPLDLAAAGRAIGSGFNRLVYTRMFMRSLKPRALTKWQQHPGLFDRAALMAAPDLYAFDNAFTAPVHGFASTEDYWARCSAKPWLKDITGLPTLVLNARNDPFVPASCLPERHEVSSWVTLWQPDEGGHVGFPGGPVPGYVTPLPRTVGNWLAQHLT
ncbi:YheT family hydrolase [Aquabacterium sp.]|uniref:YheT family hydrolase n=1 Tax=Aquabacterium sp. TaxID=1872578 RepID=UPI0035B2054D